VHRFFLAFPVAFCRNSAPVIIRYYSRHRSCLREETRSVSNVVRFTPIYDRPREFTRVDVRTARVSSDSRESGIGNRESGIGNRISRSGYGSGYFLVSVFVDRERKHCHLLSAPSCFISFFHLSRTRTRRRKIDTCVRAGFSSSIVSTYRPIDVPTYTSQTRTGLRVYTRGFLSRNAAVLSFCRLARGFIRL